MRNSLENVSVSSKINFFPHFNLFGTFQIGSNQCITSTAIYGKLHKNIELTCKVLNFILTKISYLGVMLPKLFKTIVNINFYDDSTDGPYFLPFPVMMPFDWQTPCGYLIALSAQFASAFAVLFSASTVLSFLVGSCWLFIEIVDDITTDVNHLNGDATSDESIRILKMRFHDVIEIYLDVKQLTFEFNEIYKNVISVYFSWTRLGKKDNLKME